MKRKLTLFIVLALICIAMPAQKISKKENPVVTAFSDSLTNLKAAYYAYFRMWDNLDAPAPRVRPDADYYKLFVTPTYYEAPVAQAFELNWSPEEYDKTRGKVDTIFFAKRDSITLFSVPNIEKKAKVDRWVNKILLNYYMKHPDRVTGNELYLADLKVLDDTKFVKKPRKEHIISLLEPETPVKQNVERDADLVVVRPNFWTHKGNGYLQFTQHYISDNWYKGGESTNALLSGLVLEANFDDRQRLEFENKLEMKLGFVTAPSDTVHKYKTNADLFRLNSKLGVKAFKNWYYTLAAEFKTQFFGNYKTNTNDMISNFLSPAQLDVTVGMDFKQNKKNYSLSLLTSPLAYTLMYISNDRIENPAAFNVEPGHRAANLFGSKFTGNLNWKIIPSIVWESKLEYFTTYEKVIASWENTFNFVLNRYLSTKIFVHARYDDGVTLTEDNRSYFQLQEMLTFGLNYTW
ncbi:DUF3078 domain-containing protein [Phocaeicola sp.]